MILNLCSVDTCAGQSYRCGFCKKHYARFYRHGNPLGGGTGNGEPMKFIEETVMLYEGDDCIIWPFGRGGKGYGYYTVEGKHQPIHRYICKRTHGDAPSPEHEAAHICGRGFDACVSKKHLAWKTPVENNADKYVHDTHNRGERNGAVKLSNESVIKIYALKGALSQAKIAASFGVSSATISNIHRGRKWSWLTGEGAAA